MPVGRRHELVKAYADAAESRMQELSVEQLAALYSLLGAMTASESQAAAAVAAAAAAAAAAATPAPALSCLRCCVPASRWHCSCRH